MQILVNSLLKFLNRYKYFDEVNNLAYDRLYILSLEKIMRNYF
jgi:hypothetical protein